MTTSNESEVKKPLSLSRGKLELRKTVDAGQVKQTFPHGRSKTVAVEVKRKRTYAPGAGGKMTEVPTDKDIALATAELSAEDKAHLSNLTAGERATRLKVLEEAARADEVRRVQEAEEAQRRAAEEAELAAAEEARRKAAEARGEVYPPKPPEPANDVTVEPEKPKAKVEPAVKRIEPNVVRPSRGPVPEVEEEEEPAKAKRPSLRAPAKPLAPRRDEPRRRTGK
ncbi:MAG TPA: translation initiation factor IF-2 associated domain-containing protein, partial [Dongiaceae bacterium]|nr:translation initiation factor IF-2 associated domain-containing protein [Dongiaceae bacterium]